MLPVALAAFLLAGCGNGAAGPRQGIENQVIVDSNSQIEVHMTKNQVAKTLGEPAERTEIVKKAEPVFGVVEGWFNELNHGDKIEIWRYAKPKGTFEVYFLNDSEVVWHTAFVGKNVRF